MAGRSFAALFQDSQGADEEEGFFADGSQVRNYSPPIRAPVALFRAPTAGGFSPRVGGLGAATGALGAGTGGLGAAPTFLDPAAPGMNSNSEGGVSLSTKMFCSLRGPSSDAASMWWPLRRYESGPRRSGRGTSSTACLLAQRSWARGGVVKRGRSLTNAASAQTGGHIDLDDDEEGFYCTNFNMLQNSDEEEDDSDEVTFAVLMCLTIAKYHMVSFLDGASAFCPGFDEEDNQPRNGVAADLCDGTGEDDTCSPMGSANKRTSSSSKRANNIGCRGESPSKKTKSPMVKSLRGLVNEIKIDREEGKKKEDNYAKREEARSRAMQWMAATMDQWAEEDEEEKEQEAAATERRKNIIFSAAQIIGTRRSRLRFECVRVKPMGWLVIVGPHEPVR
ncbi:hypothetical protein ZWY2020_025452 [Hordeum vulgare]|nr:hypothetical protein ZWY2020_025452 [Hordeum vulgare]